MIISGQCLIKIGKDLLFSSITHINTVTQHLLSALRRQATLFRPICQNTSSHIHSARSWRSDCNADQLEQLLVILELCQSLSNIQPFRDRNRYTEFLAPRFVGAPPRVVDQGPDNAPMLGGHRMSLVHEDLLFEMQYTRLLLQC